MIEVKLYMQSEKFKSDSNTAFNSCVYIFKTSSFIIIFLGTRPYTTTKERLEVKSFTSSLPLSLVYELYAIE